MSVSAFHAALKSHLLADADLIAWAKGHFNRALTAIDGNREIDTLSADESPALIMEMGDGEFSPEVGGHAHHATPTAQLALAWHEEDPAQAFTQRVALPDLVARALLRNPSLGGAIDEAWVSAYGPVRGGRPFVHVMRFTVSGEFKLER